MSRSSPVAPTLVLDLDLSKTHRSASQDRVLSNKSSPLIQKPRVHPCPDSPHPQCKADSLVSQLLSQVSNLRETVKTLMTEKEALREEIRTMKVVLEEKMMIGKRVSGGSAGTNLSSSTSGETAVTRVLTECKAQETLLQGKIRDLKKRLEGKGRRITGLEDELRDSRRDLESCNKANRMLRIELSSLKDTHSDPVSSLLDAKVSYEKLTQLQVDFDSAEERNKAKENQWIAQVDSLKEKNRRLKEELIRSESNLFLCRIEQELSVRQ